MSLYLYNVTFDNLTNSSNWVHQKSIIVNLTIFNYNVTTINYLFELPKIQYLELSNLPIEYLGYDTFRGLISLKILRLVKLRLNRIIPVQMKFFLGIWNY